MTTTHHTDNTTDRFSDTLRAVDGWTLTETEFDTDRAVAVGSNFMVGNGYLGYRATTPDQTADDFVALVVTDTYDCADGRWRELTTAPNPLLVEVMAAGRTLRSADASDHEWSLHLRDGRVRHRCTHKIDDVTVTVSTERFASYEILHLLGQRVDVSADGPIEVEVTAGIDARVWDLNGRHLPQIDLAVDDDLLRASGVTGESATKVSVAARVDGVGGAAVVNGDRLVRSEVVSVSPDRSATITTMAAVASSNDGDEPSSMTGRVVSAAEYDVALAVSAEDWAAFWDRNDVSIAGAPLDDAALRFGAYHNRICIPAHTDHLPVGARGLSCQAYQGAAFWDQEIYNLPAVLFTEPEVARSLLVYRHRTLDGARRKARRLGYDGAYYAWVSGETGDELCPDVFFTDVLTGREIRNHFNVWQMHVAPDIVTAIERYVAVTGDVSYLIEHGAEIAFEVARFLRSFVRFNDARGTYHCIRLLGPDEWHENVDDNAFTNHQVHVALSYAISTYAELRTLDPEAFAALRTELALDDHEVERWGHIRDHLVLPQPDAETKLVEQFDGFFELEDITPDALRERLLDPAEYWGWPNGIAVRTQVSKQADVAMLTWLHADAFTDDEVAANYDYYEPRCSHNSSLSHAAFGIAAARLGRADVALDHFRATALVDLLNTNHAVVAGTFIGGIHTAACGGTIQLAVQGIGGLGFTEDTITIEPSLPAAWTQLAYPITWRGQRLRVQVRHDGVTIGADEANDAPVAVRVNGTTMSVEPGASHVAA